MGCDYRQFCTRHRDHLLKELDSPTSVSKFSLDRNSIAFEGAKLTASLKREHTASTTKTADELSLNMWLYQDGISRITIDEPKSGRFRVAEQPILTEGVHLRPVEDIKSHVKFSENKCFTI